MTEPNEARRKSNDEEPIFSRYFLRYLSAPVTRLLLKTSVTPNQITVTFILIFLIGAAAQFDQLHRPLPIAGAVLLWVGLLLDAVDGEVARVKGIYSVKGVYLDMVAHRIVHALIFGGTATGLYLRDGVVLPLFLAMAAIFGELAFTLILYAKWRALLDYPELLAGELERIEGTPKPEQKRVKTGFEGGPRRANPLARLYHVWFGKDYVGAVFFTTLVLSILDQNVYLLWIYGVFTPVRALALFFKRMVTPFKPDLS